MRISGRLLLIFILPVLLSACAALGSRTKVFDESKLRNIRIVALVTKRADQPRSSYHSIGKHSFTKTLLEELRQQALFDIVLLDTMENENVEIDQIDISPGVDAILIAEWRLSNPAHIATDARVIISVVDTKSKRLISRSSHGTKFGNSYLWTPMLPKTLIDATEGAVRTLARKLRKVHEN